MSYKPRVDAIDFSFTFFNSNGVDSINGHRFHSGLVGSCKRYIFINLGNLYDL